jgi:two-component sensor histidine kinase
MTMTTERASPPGSPSGEDLAAHARHRTANLFQLLTTLTRMRIQRTRDTEARRQLSWLLEAMGALSVLQRRLWSPDGEDFSQFLAEMEPIWRRRCAGRPVELEIEAAAVLTPEHIASALSLIVNELVTNAIDHAFVDGRAGRIRVRLEMIAADRAGLTVEDDGRGYDPAALNGETLGLWLVKGLTTQLRGVLTTTTTGGVVARLEFPSLAAD